MSLPTPESIAKGNSEHSTQTAYFAWIGLNAARLPLLKTAFAVPNGEKRDKITASRLKAAGVRAGVWDTLLPVTDGSGWFKGLWIEFKHGKNGLTDEQIEFREKLKLQHWAWFVSYTWYDAAQAVEKYLGAGWPHTL